MVDQEPTRPLDPLDLLLIHYAVPQGGIVPELGADEADANREQPVHLLVSKSFTPWFGIITAGFRLGYASLGLADMLGSFQALLSTDLRIPSDLQYRFGRPRNEHDRLLIAWMAAQIQAGIPLIYPWRGDIREVGDFSYRGRSRFWDGWEGEVRERERELELAGFILDPDLVSVFGIGLVILGAVPTYFNVRRERGELVSREIRSRLWRYHRSRAADGSWEEVRFEIDLIRLAERFIGALRSGPDDPDRGDDARRRLP